MQVNLQLHAVFGVDAPARRKDEARLRYSEFVYAGAAQIRR